jgi:hypothetical protein
MAFAHVKCSDWLIYPQPQQGGQEFPITDRLEPMNLHEIQNLTQSRDIAINQIVRTELILLQILESI